LAFGSPTGEEGTGQNGSNSRTVWGQHLRAASAARRRSSSGEKRGEAECLGRIGGRESVSPPRKTHRSGASPASGWSRQSARPAARTGEPPRWVRRPRPGHSVSPSLVPSREAGGGGRRRCRCAPSGVPGPGPGRSARSRFGWRPPRRPVTRYRRPGSRDLWGGQRMVHHQQETGDHQENRDGRTAAGRARSHGRQGRVARFALVWGGWSQAGIDHDEGRGGGLGSS